MNETINKQPRITKAGSIILVLSLILSTLFIILGIVTLSKEENKTIWVYEDTTSRLSVDSYEYYELKFRPNYSGRYTINMDGAYIIDIISSGTKVYTKSNNDDSYDYSYQVNLTANSTYTIKVYAKSNRIVFYASK